MKKSIICVFALLLTVAAYATQLPSKELDELVAQADHVLIGKVVKVQMVDGTGKELTNPETHTGPVLDNEIRLHIVIQDDGILKTNSKKPPKELIIPLWKAWHFSLGQWEKDEGKTFIFLLKGEDFCPVYPISFMRKMSEKPEIEKLLTSKQRNQPLEEQALIQKKEQICEREFDLVLSKIKEISNKYPILDNFNTKVKVSKEFLQSQNGMRYSLDFMVNAYWTKTGGRALDANLPYVGIKFFLQSTPYDSENMGFYNISEYLKRNSCPVSGIFNTGITIYGNVASDDNSLKQEICRVLDKTARDILKQ